jgi:hypothetical protein
MSIRRYEFLDEQATAAADRIEELEAQVGVLKGIKWKSIDKDNMEYQATITCWQHDKLTAAIKESEEENWDE